MDAFVDRDADKAVAVCLRDATVDDFYNSLFRSLLTFMMENPHHITPSAHLLFIAKNLERIGDHATNVAEMVYFSRHRRTFRRPDQDRRHRLRTSEDQPMKPKILLVEDDANLVELVTYNLDKAGFDVVRTGDGEEALVLAEEEKPDLVILDWMIANLSRASKSVAVCAARRPPPGCRSSC